MSEKKNKYNPDDYIYGSARIAAIDTKVVGADILRSASEARTYEDAISAIEKTGINLRNGVDRGLDGYLSDAFESLNKLAPDEHLFDIFRYQYDCHNIKTAIKASVLKQEREGLLYSIGTVDKDVVPGLIRESNYSAFPKNMADAIAKCIDEYYRSSNPQRIDLALDRACFLDMVECAEESGIGFLKELTEYKADSVNLLTCVRMIRMRAPKSLLEEALVPGGKITPEEMYEAVEYSPKAAECEDKLYHTASAHGYKIGFDHRATLTEVEKGCEKLYFDFVCQSAGDTLYGVEVPCSFIVKREREVKNIRIVLSGKASGVPAKLISERLR